MKWKVIKGDSPSVNSCDIYFLSSSDALNKHRYCADR